MTLGSDGAATAALIPEFGTIDTWCQISGMGRRTTYDELGKGNLKAVKAGARTLIKSAKVWRGCIHCLRPKYARRVNGLPPKNRNAATQAREATFHVSSNCQPAKPI